MAMGFGVFPLVPEGATKRGLLLFVILAPSYYLRAAILASGTVPRSERITVHKFLRSVHVDWGEIFLWDAFRCPAE
jgi:hypothetical protein